MHQYGSREVRQRREGKQKKKFVIKQVTTVGNELQLLGLLGDSVGPTPQK